MKKNLITILLTCAAPVFCAPVTDQRPEIENFHGTEVIDPYRWLEDSDSEEVLDWIEAQNDYTKGVVNQFQAREAIEYELSSLYSSAYSRTIRLGNDDRFLLLRKKRSDSHPIVFLLDGVSKELTTLIDPNSWEPGDSIGEISLANSRYLVYTRANGGSEMPEIHILDLESCQELDHHLEGWIHRGIYWHENGSQFFYTAYPKKGTVPAGEEYFYAAVYRHDIETGESQKIFHNPSNFGWYYYVADCSDELLRVEMISFELGNEVWEVDLRTPDFSAKCIGRKAPDDYYYSLTHINGHDYLVTDQRRQNREVLRYVEGESAVPFIVASDILVEEVYGIAKTIVVKGRRNGYSVLRLYNEKGTYLGEVPLPGLGSAEVSGRWGDSDILIGFETIGQPREIYSYAVEDQQLFLLDQEEIPGYTSGSLTTELALVPSTGGVEVPMFIARRTDLALSGDAPVYLTGYGGFGISCFPEFQRGFYPLLKAGGIIAMPLLRGGGEQGGWWHRSGRLASKQNVFDDFINCAEWLISAGYTNPTKIAIQGASNGGLLMGAVATQRPDLFRCVWCSVGLLDMLHYHQFRIGRTWVPEYGCADDVSDFPFLYAYSPYHNIREGTQYPAIMFQSGHNDWRVDPMHARKMVASMQLAQGGDEPILLQENFDRGHFFQSGEKGLVAGVAERYAFAAHYLGIESLFDVPTRDLPEPPLALQIARELEDQEGWNKKVVREELFHKVFDRVDRLKKQREFMVPSR